MSAVSEVFQQLYGLLIGRVAILVLLLAGKLFPFRRAFHALAARLVDARPPAHLIEAAKVDPDAFTALRLLVAMALERGAELRPEVRTWLAGFLRGDIVPPKKRGRPKKDQAKTGALHVTIFLAVAMLQTRGMTATRNDDSPHRSACDAVAQALKEFRMLPQSYKGVKRIWESNNRALKAATPRS